MICNRNHLFSAPYSPGTEGSVSSLIYWLPFDGCCAVKKKVIKVLQDLKKYLSSLQTQMAICCSFCVMEIQPNEWNLKKYDSYRNACSLAQLYSVNMLVIMLLACKHLLISAEHKVELRLMGMFLALQVFGHKPKYQRNSSFIGESHQSY